MIIAPESPPPFLPPLCTKSGPTIEIAFVFMKEILDFLVIDSDCASYWLQNYNWDSSFCLNTINDLSILNDLNISNMFHVRLCNTSTSVIHGKFVPFKFEKNDFTLGDRKRF